MRALFYVLSFLALIGLGFWAYRENYATQAALHEVRSLQRQISNLHESLAVQRAEWAYLNRPARLRELVELNFDRLGLMPMEADQFGRVETVPYPPEDAAPDTQQIAIDDLIQSITETAAILPRAKAPSGTPARGF